MSGDINNTDILAALNQTIKAINDLCGCNQISITCGGGGNTGTQIEQESGTEGGTPPEGTSSPDPSISERKCKAANMIYDDLKAIIDQLDLQDIGTWDLVGVVPSSDLLGQIITTVGGWVGSAISSVAGMVLNAAAWLLSTFASLSFSNISSVMNTYHQDLVCALFNATDAETARADFLTILTDNGVTSAESAFVEFLMPMNVMNVLFFAVDDPDSEATLDGYVGSVDCSVCATCPQIYVSLGNDLGGGTFQAVSLAPDPNYGIVIYFNWDEDDGSQCGPPVEIQISNLQGWTVNTFGGSSGVTESFRFQEPYGMGADCVVWNVYCSDVIPAGSYCVRRITIRGDTQFTFDLAVVNPDCS